MPSICIISGSHLCRNPRVVKEAETLSEAGYEVIVLSPTFSEELAMQDEEIVRQAVWKKTTTVDLRAEHIGRLNNLALRGRRRLAAEVIRYLHWETRHAIGYGMSQSLTAAENLKCDLFIGHQEIGSWVVRELAKKGERIGADLEDWYSHDLLPEAQVNRPLRLLRQCEEFLLNHGDHITTTSQAMAGALAKAYNSPKPTVIYNCFPWSDRKHLDLLNKDRKDQSLLSIHWVSQTIGAGRGLEMLCTSLHYVDTPVQVHLRGTYTASVETWLRNLFPHHKGHHLYLHDLVPPGELLSRIAEHDVGLAIESTEPDSRNFTVTNKLFHYLLAGLAVVATGTAGQSEIAGVAPTAIKLFPSEDAHALATQLNIFLKEPATLAAAKAAALKFAKEKYCWEKQSPVLLNSVEQALQNGHC